jgi:hypothetical protein
MLGSGTLLRLFPGVVTATLSSGCSQAAEVGPQTHSKKLSRALCQEGSGVGGGGWEKVM